MTVRQFARNRRRRRRGTRRPVNVLASGMTTFGLYFGMASIVKAVQLEYKWAALYILIALVFDTLDGTVAKLTKSMSEFGKQLDALADLVSFGVAPGILIYMSFLGGGDEPFDLARARFGSVFAIIYVICAALRLARFNAYQSTRRDMFSGLPSPAAGTTVASLLLFTEHFELALNYYLIAAFTLLLAGLMVSTVRYPKERLKAWMLAPRSAFNYLVILVVLIAIYHYASEHSPSIVLLPLALAYVFFGIADELYLRFYKHDKPDPLMPYKIPEEDPPATEIHDDDQEPPPDSPESTNIRDAL
jgi:CDP-diacylglycerol---serine O-phosphatidyltransferase